MMASCCLGRNQFAAAVLMCSVLIPLSTATSQSAASERDDDSTPTDTLFVDHRTGTMIYRKSEVDPGDEIRARSEEVAVRITNTNSAFYACDLTEKAAKLPETEASERASIGFASYGNDPGLTGVNAAGAAGLKGLLDSIDAALAGTRGLERARARTIATLELMRSDKAIPEQLAASLKRSLEADGACLDDCSQLVAITQLSTAYQNLATLIPTADRKSPLFSIAQRALREQTEVMTAAYETSALVNHVAHAASVVDCRNVKPSGAEGRTLAFRVTPRDLPELQHLAQRAPLRAQFTVQPDRTWRGAVSGGLLYGPGQRYPKFSARETGDETRVASAGTLDQRVDFGLVLSVTNRALDHRADHGLTWWPLDLVINPSGGIQSIGAGTSFSYRVFRFGVGHLWSRHEELGGQVIGQLLGEAEDLNVRDSYRPPRNHWKGLYLVMAITGIPPFVPEAP